MNELFIIIKKELGLNNKITPTQRIIARHIFCFCARQLNLGSYEKIGKVINRDHATAMHGVKVVKNLIETNYKINSDLFVKDIVNEVIEKYNVFINQVLIKTNEGVVLNYKLFER
jgi:predicted membrane protein